MADPLPQRKNYHETNQKTDDLPPLGGLDPNPGDYLHN